MLERWSSIALNTVACIIGGLFAIFAAVFRERECETALDNVWVVTVVSSFNAVLYANAVCDLEMDPSLSGLALVYSLQLMGLSSISIRYFAKVETAMTSLERVRENLKLTEDGGTGKGGSLVLNHPSTEGGATMHRAWPAEGRVEFVHVNFRYRPELPLVLHNLSLSVEARENFGICGRTGSGKSSIIQCLLRLFEIENNADLGDVESDKRSGIYIDGLSTREIDLHTLRSSIALVPQDPVSCFDFFFFFLFFGVWVCGAHKTNKPLLCILIGPLCWHAALQYRSSQRTR